MMGSTITIHGEEMTPDAAASMCKEKICQGQHEEAIALADTLIIQQPDVALWRYWKGVASSQQGNLQQAIESHRDARKRAQNYHDNTLELANNLAASGALEEAGALFQELVDAAPEKRTIAKYNLAKVLFQMQHYTEAEQGFFDSLPYHANDVDIYINLGSCKFNQNEFEQAILWFKLGLSIDPHDEKLLGNIGMAYMKANRHYVAIDCFRQQLEVNPNNYTALYCMAMCYNALSKTREAEQLITVYLAKGKFDAEIDEVNALMILAGLKKAQSLTEEAIAIEKDIVIRFPSYEAAFSNMLLNMMYSDTLPVQEKFEWHKRYGERYETYSPEHPPRHKNMPDPNRKIRVGYVSADFHYHSVSHFALPLIARHNKIDFEVYCYATVQRTDVVTEQFQRESVWRQVENLRDHELAEKIREDEIDILVDLSGHTGGNRLIAFGEKPAPIEISWLGYPFTTGLRSMDYRIVDALVEPEGAEAINTEKLLHIPGVFCAYRPSVRFPSRLVNGELDVQELPALKNGFITFGSCNNLVKLSDSTLLVWVRLLQQVPKSKLLIEAPNVNIDGPATALVQRFERLGLPKERLILSEKKNNLQYTLYNEIDIALDPFPCNGGTTTCDALFMGVPVVSIIGDTFMGRMGLTLLTNSGHPEWLAHTEDEYIEIALNLASDIPALAKIRANLRQDVESSPLMDEIGFARKIERAYRTVWAEWCATQTGQATQPEQIINQPELDASTLAHIQEMLDSTQWEAAIPLLQDLPSAHPQCSPLWTQLAKCYQRSGQLEQTVEAYRLAAHCDNHNLVAHYGLADVQVHRAQQIGMASSDSNAWFNDAVNHLQALLEQDATNIAAWSLLSYIHMYRNRPAEAEVVIQRIFKLDPDNVQALINHSSLLMQRNQYNLAEKTLLRVVNLAPNNAWAHHNLGMLYAKMGDVEKAMPYNLQAHMLANNNKDILDGLLLQSVYFDGLSDDAKFALHRKYAEIVHEAPPSTSHLNLPDPERKLRIGFVSGDLVHSSVLYVTLPTFTHLDPEKFEIYYYHNGNSYDKMTEQLQAMAQGRWRFTKGLDVQTMEALIRDDQIDILIDLSGHVEHNALETFARKPAPVQATWASYPATTGLANMDYVITDRVMLPPDSAQLQYWTETPQYLPNSFVAYRPFMFNPERHIIPAYNVEDTPAKKNGYITFGSGTNPVRLTEFTIALWAKVMRATPKSMLRLEYPLSLPALQLVNTGPLAKVFDLFQKYGIERTRIQVSLRNSQSQYFFYHDIDIALDCFPSNTGVTTLDTLWMGVPLVTLKGEAAASRIGASFLKQLNKDEWVAENAEDFVTIASSLAADIEALNVTRHSLRPAMQASALLNEAQFAADFGDSLREMWRAWCKSDAAQTAKQAHEQQESLQLCALLLEREDYDAAITGYQAVLSHYPDCLEALYGLGLAVLLAGDAQTALPVLQKVNEALEAHQETVMRSDCLVALANACQMLGQKEEAVHFLTASLSLRHSEDVAQQLLALTQQSMVLH